MRRLACIALALLAAAACEASQRTALPPQPPTAVPRAPSADEAVRARLQRTEIGRIAFTAETGGYQDVLALIRAVADVPIVVTAEARSVIATHDMRLVLDVRAPISAANLLDLMFDPTPDLGWIVRAGVVEVFATEARPDERVVVTHDVRDLVFARTEFLPPVLGGIPTGEPGVTPRRGGEGDEKTSAVDPEALLELLRQATDPARWERGEGTIEYLPSGYVLVHAPRPLQRAVARALQRLR